MWLNWHSYFENPVARYFSSTTFWKSTGWFEVSTVYRWLTICTFRHIFPRHRRWKACVLTIVLVSSKHYSLLKTYALCECAVTCFHNLHSLAWQGSYRLCSFLCLKIATRSILQHCQCLRIYNTEYQRFPNISLSAVENVRFYEKNTTLLNYHVHFWVSGCTSQL